MGVFSSEHIEQLAIKMHLSEYLNTLRESEC